MVRDTHRTIPFPNPLSRSANESPRHYSDGAPPLSVDPVSRSASDSILDGEPPSYTTSDLILAVDLDSHSADSILSDY